MSLDLGKVFDLKRNVFIEACAGAGKTWLLSKRYAAIINRFARERTLDPQAPLRDASNILVITFTRKAAAEMSGRIYADLDILLNDEAIPNTPEAFGGDLRNASEAYKLHLRATYSRNAISTIDAFCTQILRDHAEVLDMDPEFRIQDEADTQRLISETWEQFLREASRSRDPNLAYLLGHLSEFHIREYISRIQSHSELLQKWLETHAATSPEELEERFKAEHPLPAALAHLSPLIKSLVQDLPAPDEMLDPDHAHYQKVATLSVLIKEIPEDDYEHALQLVGAVKNLVLLGTGDKYLSQIRVPNQVWPGDWKQIISARIKTFVNAVQDLFPLETLRGMPKPADLRACAVQHHLSKFFLAYRKALQQRLQQENILSFNEVIIQAHALLQDPSVAAHYGNRYSHILFDEFQDTNDLRWDIVRLIAESGAGTLRSKGLFIVGNAKQSIYRFNQADVQVMNQVRLLLEDSGAHILSTDITYRSSHAYVEEVINPLITASFPGPEEVDDLPLYETVFRPTKAAQQSPLADEVRDLSRLSVHAVLTHSNAQDPPDVIRTARLTLEWQDWLAKHTFQKNASPQIGILLRSFTHILDYIRIFTQMGVSFEVVSSKGLYDQQESFDVYHFLSVLNNPMDDLSLVGLLRSPFFAMQDRDIHKLRELKGGSRASGWCWRSLRQLHPDIYGMIRKWQERAGREPLDRLLTQIIGESDRVLGWISETGGPLRLENIRKLIHIIHGLSLDGLSMREVLEYLRYQIQHGEAAQAELPGRAQVQILSIHKSKGLQYPVVILPELHGQPPAERSGMHLGNVDGDWTIGLTLDGFNSSEQTLLYEQVKTQNLAEELAEDKRLFYVAVTRAQLGISFVARIDPNRKPAASSWWSRYLQPVFDLDLDKETLKSEPEALAREWEERSGPSQHFELALEPAPTRVDQDSELIAPVQFVPQVPPVRRLNFTEISPHVIMDWMDLKAGRGADERVRGEDLGLETAALTFGRLLHRVMEMEWFDLEEHEDDILQFLQDEGVVEEETLKSFTEDLRICLGIYQESTLSQHLTGIPSALKLPELPVFGYLRHAKGVYKINGIIDLLYFDGEVWKVLDYKTDRELPGNLEDHDYVYWYQIQTYLWMLKQLYGIEARGELYFNRFDKLIEIPYDEDLYLERLSRKQGFEDLESFLPGHARANEELLQIVRRLDRNVSTLIIEPTRDSCERLAQALSAQGAHFPNLQILTISELKRSLDSGGRRLTPYLSRLGVAAILGKRPRWGVVNRLAEAFFKATLGEQIVPGKQELYKAFQDWCTAKGLIPAAQNWELSRLDKSTGIIIDGLSSTSPSDYDFLKDLASEQQVIFLNPIRQGRPEPGFKLDMGDWARQSTLPDRKPVHGLVSCYNVQEEVKWVADQVHELLAGGVEASDIQIAVSSMERYVPSIVRIFAEQQLSVRLSKREPVLERPVAQLAFALIQGRLSTRLTWDQAMAVWLHPLVVKGGKELDKRQRLDTEIRKLGITMLDEDIIKHFEGLQADLQAALTESAQDLLKFASETWKMGSRDNLVESAEWLLDILKGFEFTLQLEPGSVASKAYTSLKNAVEGVKRDWQKFLAQPGSISDLKRELRERLRGVEVSSTDQGFGLDVTSFLDTLNLQAPYLFVMGMTEGQFPVSPNINPFLQPPRLNPWFLNLTLFKKWLTYEPGHIFFSAPERDAGGEALQISTFSQYLLELPRADVKVRSLIQQFETSSGRLIRDPQTSRALRHNDLQTHEGSGAWFGQLEAWSEKPSLTISATAFDDLVRCPQKYWYARMLRLESAEIDMLAQTDKSLGTLVHQVLEKFGKAGGFLRVAEDLDKGLKQLQEVAEGHLEELGVDLNADLLDEKWASLYFKDYEDPKRNLLAALLKGERPLLQDFFNEGFHEQSFGDKNDPEAWEGYEILTDDIDLRIRGQIDRVLENDQAIWATDYKTGKVDLKQTKELWTTQLLFYYLVLKSRWPDRDVILSYEQLKGFQKDQFGFKGHVGDLAPGHPVMEKLSPKGSQLLEIMDGADWSIERIQAETLSFAQYLVQRSFPLTERDHKTACAYCEFERICRRDSLPH